jgi:hypothetical protein
MQDQELARKRLAHGLRRASVRQGDFFASARFRQNARQRMDRIDPEALSLLGHGRGADSPREKACAEDEEERCRGGCRRPHPARRARQPERAARAVEGGLHDGRRRIRG